ncbi:methyltransferase domain-containing protein (plasmid) [Streptosporangium sp. NBC_01495]|uniref:class I SAM-dependent methyltransferase n=1 Tax=Streptosporangium sp. NBC_01495 TaxID=2903899 RepID=UPI002E2F54F8|nr:methyltransferase domain-containing protein [Streptosporangium sp. NBC_01495]
MAETPERFSVGLAAWQQWQEAPWGRIRYTVAEANLVSHLESLGEERLRILDLAGGDGGDAIRLAAQGHHITIVDHAPAMLAAADQRAAAAGLTDRIVCVEADVSALPRDITAARFDVVLCHNLLAYTDDVTATLRAALTPLAPGGLLSVIATNQYSAALNVAVREMDPAAALAALASDQARTQTFDSALTLHTAEKIIAILEELGCGRVDHFGIRSFCDYIIDDDRKDESAFYADLERLELAVTHRHPYMHTARLFQLITRTRDR